MTSPDLKPCPACNDTPCRVPPLHDQSESHRDVAKVETSPSGEEFARLSDEMADLRAEVAQLTKERDEARAEIARLVANPPDVSFCPEVDRLKGQVALLKQMLRDEIAREVGDGK